MFDHSLYFYFICMHSKRTKTNLGGKTGQQFIQRSFQSYTLAFFLFYNVTKKFYLAFFHDFPNFKVPTRNFSHTFLMDQGENEIFLQSICVLHVYPKSDVSYAVHIHPVHQMFSVVLPTYI